MENITDEQKQKIKDYQKYYKKYYIEKKLAAKDTKKNKNF